MTSAKYEPITEYHACVFFVSVCAWHILLFIQHFIEFFLIKGTIRFAFFGRGLIGFHRGFESYFSSVIISQQI